MEKLRAYIDRIVLRQELVLPSGETLSIDGMNRSRGRNELVIYHPHFHAVTLTMPDGVEVAVKNHKVSGTTTNKGVRAFRQMAISFRRVVGKARIYWHISRKMMRCRSVRRSYQNASVTAIYGEVSSILSGVGPLLLRDKTAPQTEAYEREGFDQAFHSFWHPRTAIGKKADGTLLFVTITAATAGVRRGVMLPRLSELFLEWGATDALNLDGGNSSMLVSRTRS